MRFLYKTKIVRKSLRGTENGFTLVEFMVGIAIFITVLTLAVGLFIQALKIQKNLTAEMAVSNNVNFVLEQIARTVKAGYGFQSDIVTSAWFVASSTPLSFQSKRSTGIISVSYKLDEDAIWEAIAPGDFKRLTSENVVVTDFSFFVNHPNICYPWRITIFLGIIARDSLSKKPTYIQTTVSSRILPMDIKDSGCQS